MNSVWPEEVLAYLNHGPRNVVRVEANRPYELTALFDDGEMRRIDMKDELTGVMAPLNDPEIFSAVTIDDLGCISWNTPNGTVDISKDTIYIYGEKVLSM